MIMQVDSNCIGLRIWVYTITRQAIHNQHKLATRRYARLNLCVASVLCGYEYVFIYYELHAPTCLLLYITIKI